MLSQIIPINKKRTLFQVYVYDPTLVAHASAAQGKTSKKQQYAKGELGHLTVHYTSKPANRH